MGKQIEPGVFVKTQTICWYSTESSKSRSAMKKALDDISKGLGYSSIARPGRGQFASVLKDIASGKLVIIPREEYEKLRAVTPEEEAVTTEAEAA